MDVLLPKILAAFVLPPGCLLVLAALGLAALARGRQGAGAGLLALAFAALLALSLPIVADSLAARLADRPPLDARAPALGDAGAIVVLGGGRHAGAAEYGGDTVSAATLVRVRYGARLHRLSGLPLLVTGGVVRGSGPPEAELMAAVLRDELGVPVRWVEARSRNTAENARYSAAILEQAGIGSIALVTHAVHLPRAIARFERAGLAVVPAPTALATPPAAASVFDWLPGAGAFEKSAAVLHEHLGAVWYAVRY